MSLTFITIKIQYSGRHLIRRYFDLINFQEFNLVHKTELFKKTNKTKKLVSRITHIQHFKYYDTSSINNTFSSPIWTSRLETSCSGEISESSKAVPSIQSIIKEALLKSVSSHFKQTTEFIEFSKVNKGTNTFNFQLICLAVIGESNTALPKFVFETNLPIHVQSAEYDTKTLP